MDNNDRNRKAVIVRTFENIVSRTTFLWYQDKLMAKRVQ